MDLPTVVGQQKQSYTEVSFLAPAFLATACFYVTGSSFNDKSLIILFHFYYTHIMIAVNRFISIFGAISVERLYAPFQLSTSIIFRLTIVILTDTLSVMLGST